MVVRLTFTTELYIDGENLQDVARQWEKMELFSDEASECGACQISLDSVEDENGNDISDEFNKW